MPSDGLTVIVPVFNAAHEVQACLHSLWVSTQGQCEVIVIDFYEHDLQIIQNCLYFSPFHLDTNRIWVSIPSFALTETDACLDVPTKISPYPKPVRIGVAVVVVVES